MANRRQFLSGLLATGLLPAPTWADAGGPSFVSAAARADGRFVLCGIGKDRRIRFKIPIPARGHAAATHPLRPEVVAFARRPGTFAVVIDCSTGRPIARLTAPAGRHFYGHGVFSKDGQWLFTTENDFEAGQGRIGLWNASAGYARVAEFSSGGIGPHDIKRLPGSDVLVIANGGIDTHPDSGRTKLNVPTMAPNLSYVLDGNIIETVSLPAELHKNSIRHLAVSKSGQVAFGMQWQGDSEVLSLVGMHVRGNPVVLCKAAPDEVRALQGYVGSIAFGHDLSQIAITSPRGNVVQIYDTASATHLQTQHIQDACGVAAYGAGFMVTGGTGNISFIAGDNMAEPEHTTLRWDNHLVAV